MRVLEAAKTMLQEKGGINVSIVMQNQVDTPTTIMEMIEQEEEESRTVWKEIYRLAIHHSIYGERKYLYVSETEVAGHNVNLSNAS